MRSLIAALAVLLLAAAPAELPKPEAPAPASADDDLKELLASMTLEEKVAQTIMSYPPLDKTGPVTVGAVVLTKDLLKKADAVRARVESLQSRARIPLLVAVDQEGGRLNRIKVLKGYESVPSAEELGRTDEATARAAGRTQGKAMRSLGLNCDLAPVLDVADKGVMKEWGRTFGGDPERVGKLGAAYARGLLEAGVVPIAKHYPGYGELAENTDFHVAVADRSAEEMKAGLRPFEVAKPYLAGVLMANVAYRSHGAVPAILSPELVGLAHAQGFLTVTDDLAVGALCEAISGKPEDVVRRAFLAGNDILLTTEPIDWEKALDYRKVVLDLLKERPDLEPRLDQSVLRVLQIKRKAGLLTPEVVAKAKAARPTLVRAPSPAP